jgi:hypothetical protein
LASDLKCEFEMGTAGLASDLKCEFEIKLGYYGWHQS